MKKVIAYIVALISLASCSSNCIYSHYEDLPMAGWPSDSAYEFRFDVTDTIQAYDIILNLRHSEHYPYRNVWFFTELYQTDSVSGHITLSSDTLEYYLADRRGRWLGNGFGRLKDMPMLIQSNMYFAHPGTYYMQVKQGMREEKLCGVSELGLTVQKVAQ